MSHDTQDNIQIDQEPKQNIKSREQSGINQGKASSSVHLSDLQKA